MNNLTEGMRIKIKINGKIREAIVAEPLDPIFPACVLILDRPISFTINGIHICSWSADKLVNEKYWEQLAALYGCSAYSDLFWKWDRHTVLECVLNNPNADTLKIPVAQSVSLTGFNCHLCNNRNDYAEANVLIDGEPAYRCFDCR